MIDVQDAGQRDPIAMYASALGNNAAERLRDVLCALTTDVAERRLGLIRAKYQWIGYGRRCDYS